MLDRLTKKTLFGSLPPPLAATPVAAARKVVVLDDDPTGTQTVHGVPVLMTWTTETLATELLRPEPCCYLLTNTRAFSRAEAIRINREIGHNLLAAGRQTGRAFRVISRSDSTLRGHFPAEVEALASGLKTFFDATLVIPAFFAGGRYTANDIHYVAQGDDLVPVGETEFARDAEFGFKSSNLREWVEEKTGGVHRAAEVRSITLDHIRTGGAPEVLRELLSTPKGSYVVVNAAATSDLAILTQALAQAEGQGRWYLFRTAADFVPLYAGITPRALLSTTELRSGISDTGGLLVAGSYVGRTSSQLESLFARLPLMTRVEVDVTALVVPARRHQEISRARDAVTQAIMQAKDVALFTSRALLQGANADEFATIREKVVTGLIEIVQTLSLRPAWLISKGGITSSDLASKALGMKRAMVLGQALPGVPVWAPGNESKWPGLPFIVFPGNVGDADALSELVSRLSAR